MKTHQALFVSLLLAPALAATGTANAQNAGLHHAQSGALLGYADAEIKVLYAALTDRQFDLELVERLIAELDRTVTDAKRSTDRSTDLLDEKQAKLRPELEKIRKLLVAAEKELGMLKSDIEGQVKPFLKQLEGDDDERDGVPEAAPEPDWERLKAHAGWIASDVGGAAKLHGKLSKKLKGPRLRTPPKPKGAHP